MPNLSYLDDPWPDPTPEEFLYGAFDGDYPPCDDVGGPEDDYLDRWGDDWPVEDPGLIGPYEEKDLEVEDIIPPHLIRSWELD